MQFKMMTMINKTQKVKSVHQNPPLPPKDVIFCWPKNIDMRPKIWNSCYPKQPEKGYCTISLERNAIQNDDHDLIDIRQH